MFLLASTDSWKSFSDSGITKQLNNKLRLSRFVFLFFQPTRHQLIGKWIQYVNFVMNESFVIYTIIGSTLFHNCLVTKSWLFCEIHTDVSFNSLYFSLQWKQNNKKQHQK